MFGITGDLARKMTLQVALPAGATRDARLPGDRRRPRALDRSTTCASTRWTRSRSLGGAARRRSSTGSLPGSSYVAGRLRRPTTYEASRPTPSRRREAPVFYLEIPPFLFARWSSDLHDAGLTKDARVVVEKPFGHDFASACAAQRRAAHAAHRRVAALPDRPLPGEDVGRGHHVPALCQHDARADLEPAVRLLGADHDGRGLRRRRSRALLRPGRSDARRRPEPPAAGAEHGRDGAADRRRPRHDQRPQARRVPGDARAPIPTKYVRGQYDGYLDVEGRGSRLARPRRSARCGSRSTTGAGTACRSTSARARRCPRR